MISTNTGKNPCTNQTTQKSPHLAICSISYTITEKRNMTQNYKCHISELPFL
jgi:hypothetical protein